MKLINYLIPITIFIMVFIGTNFSLPYSDGTAVMLASQVDSLDEFYDITKGTEFESSYALFNNNFPDLDLNVTGPITDFQRSYFLELQDEFVSVLYPIACEASGGTLITLWGKIWSYLRVNIYLFNPFRAISLI